MQKSNQKFFLGANSAEGFISHFGDSYLPGTWRAYIIKGGPGTGKSSFMKYVAVKAFDKGYTVTLCPCSSDPDSLDGVIIEELKIILLDGTAPHVVEPSVPGACENIINLGDFWDGDKLFRNSKKIIKTAGENSRLHKTVSAYISAAGELIYDNLKLSRLCTNRNAVIKFASRLSAKHIPIKSNLKGNEFFRFLGGVTPKGIVGFSKTVTDFYKNTVVIDDKYGAASGEIMKYIRASAIEKGYDIITVKNPLLPSEIIDHILIPELSLAFVTENTFIKFDINVRRIHARRFTDKSKEKGYRGRMLFNRRVSNELLLGACQTLKHAKEVHDKLEKFYIDAMDFNSLTNFATQKAEEILG